MLLPFPRYTSITPLHSYPVGGFSYNGFIMRVDYITNSFVVNIFVGIDEGHDTGSKLFGVSKIDEDRNGVTSQTFGRILGGSGNRVMQLGVPVLF